MPRSVWFYQDDAHIFLVGKNVSLTNWHSRINQMGGGLPFILMLGGVIFNILKGIYHCPIEIIK